MHSVFSVGVLFLQMYLFNTFTERHRWEVIAPAVNNRRTAHCTWRLQFPVYFHIHPSQDEVAGKHCFFSVHRSLAFYDSMIRAAINAAGKKNM
jgi:hypothetical protein